ncbi:MAG: hypothetical protein MI740_15760, partial [Halanaerobiales bacterium]|nr:hypothetical protein [Halanaerobiales bacterium]
MKFLLASSMGETLQMAAAGIKPQGTMVPPPTQIAVICPKAAKTDALTLTACANTLANEPAKEIPEKPEPSRPVMAPTALSMEQTITLFIGMAWARAIP